MESDDDNNSQKDESEESGDSEEESGSEEEEVCELSIYHLFIVKYCSYRLISLSIVFLAAK